jgi:cytochrome c oxidase assembly protein subunit 15
LLQATLGVWTLLLRVPTPLGLAHQAGAIVLFAATLSHFWLTLRRTAVIKNAQGTASA